MTKNDPLLQPYQLKHLTLRNRIMSTAHEPAYSEDGMPKDRYRLYHVEKAKGGIALTMTAGSALVSEDSPPAFGNLHGYKDEIVPWLRKIADECHEHGTAVMIQITHLGRRTNWNKSDWLPVLAASSVREPAHRSFPKKIEDWDIERIVADYATAAERMKDAGLDGIEIQAYGHLMDGFWSPATNKRNDQFGGSLDNRLNFSWQVINAIRAKVGEEFIVGIRMVADEDWDIGLSKKDGIEIATRFAQSGKIDFLNLIRGHIDTDAALSKVIPIQGTPSAPHLEFVGEVRAATRFPVFHASRINDVATARHAVEAGKMDMVGLTRAHIADPHIARKVSEGREEEIRPCVGATYCLDRIYEGHEALCIHNAATGRELTMPHIIKRITGSPKHAVVVGAGPAGLEVARVLAERGHKVIVFEAASEAGGQVRLAARSPRRKELIGIIDWRLGQCEKHGVEFRYNIFADNNEVLASSPEIVVIATGGLPNTDVLKSGAEFAISSWDILSGDQSPGTNALVFDDNGGHPAMQVAEWLVDAGTKVEIISPERFFAPEMGGLNHVPYAQKLQNNGAVITINSKLISISRSGNELCCVIGSDYSEVTTERTVDQVVIEHGTLPLDDLYFSLKADSINLGAVSYRDFVKLQSPFPTKNPDGAYTLVRIGDAVASRNIHAAIYDGLRFGIQL